MIKDSAVISHLYVAFFKHHSQLVPIVPDQHIATQCYFFPFMHRNIKWKLLEWKLKKKKKEYPRINGTYSVGPDNARQFANLY